MLQSPNSPHKTPQGPGGWATNPLNKVGEPLNMLQWSRLHQNLRHLGYQTKTVKLESSKPLFKINVVGEA